MNNKKSKKLIKNNTKSRKSLKNNLKAICVLHQNNNNIYRQGKDISHGKGGIAIINIQETQGLEFDEVFFAAIQPEAAATGNNNHNMSSISHSEIEYAWPQKIVFEFLKQMQTPQKNRGVTN